MCHSLTPKRAQGGVALLTALLIVALATLTAVAMSTRQQVDIRRSANLFARQQAQAYVIGAETWARQILQRDLLMSDSDHSQELWALDLPPTQVEGGQMRGRLYDLHSQLNLNNLLDANGEPDALTSARLQRLLAYLELPSELLAVMLDWIDTDQQPTLPGGAEDNTYLLKTPAYRAANQLFSSVSELYLLHGMTPEYVQQLRPYVTVLPTRTALNVNTAPAPVLISLAEAFTTSQIETLLAAREETPFNSMNDFLTHEALAGTAFDNVGLTVNSQYFLLHAEATIGAARAQLFSVLRRDNDNKVQVLRRVFNAVDYQPVSLERPAQAAD